jgi:heme-degrading monooxygenase HmoA
VILRIVRAEVRPGREEELSDAFQAVVRQALPEIPGLVRGTFARNMEDDGERILLVTVWNDWQSLREAIGDDWDRPHFFAVFHDLIESADVEHYEVGAEYIQGAGVTMPVPSWDQEGEGQSAGTEPADARS